MAEASKRMSETALRQLIDRKIANSVGAGTTSDPVTRDRLKAMKYYKGEPFGDEKPGSSKIVSRDVAEAVDSMLPSLMKIFSSGDEVATFAPTRAEEEEAARQATDYVNWIWSQQNDGYSNFETWFKDGLLQKLGTVKIWWEEGTHLTREAYEGLTQAEYDVLCEDPDLELVEHEARPDPDVPLSPPGMASGGAPPLPGATDGAAPQPMPAMPPQGPAPLAPGAMAMPPAPPPMLHDAVFRRRHDMSRVRIAPVAPDDTLIERQSGSDELPWGDRRRRTVAELIEEFPDKKEELKNLPAEDGHDFDQERLERFQDEGMLPRDASTVEGLMRTVWVVDAYFRVDFDGDGYAEFRKVTTAGATPGSTGLVLENVEYDDNPFACVTPILLPHKLIGMSIADQTTDIQLTKSTLVRQGLNNLYLANNSEVFVKGRVDMDALLHRRPGNVIRGEANSSLEPIVTPPVLGDVLAAVQYFDGVRDQRTGAARFTAGPGADALDSAYTQTATGANMVETASQERIAHIARRFAETGVKKAFRRIYELVCKHQERSKMVKLRGQWTEINPSDWNSRMDMTVTVGLGTNNKSVQVQQLMMLLTQIYAPIVQMQAGLNGPLVFPKNIHQALTKTVEAMGFKAADQFFPDPSAAAAAPPPPPPDPKLIELQSKERIADADRQADMAKAQLQIGSQERVAQLNAAVQREGNTLKAGVDNKAIDVDAVLTAHKHDTETYFRQLDGQRADRDHAHAAATGDREHAFKVETAQAGKVEAAPPRRMTHVTLVHDAAGKVAATKRHFDDGSHEELPIMRETVGAGS